MPIVVTCPCSRVLRVFDSFAGKKVRCPQCQQPLLVPAAMAEPKSLELPPSRVQPPPLPKPELDPEEVTFQVLSTPPRLSEPILLEPVLEEWDDDERDSREERPRKKRKRKRKSTDPTPVSGMFERRDAGFGGFGTPNAGVFGGIFMIIIGTAWLLGGLYAGRLFFYAPVLIVIGIFAFFKGVLGND